MSFLDLMRYSLFGLREVYKSILIPVFFSFSLGHQELWWRWVIKMLVVMDRVLLDDHRGEERKEEVRPKVMPNQVVAVIGDHWGSFVITSGILISFLSFLSAGNGMMRLKILLKMILKNSKLAQTWLIGKVEFVISSKGGDKNCWNINVTRRRKEI